jgi:hypothetical protein
VIRGDQPEGQLAGGVKRPGGEEGPTCGGLVSGHEGEQRLFSVQPGGDDRWDRPLQAGDPCGHLSHVWSSPELLDTIKST